VDAVLQAVDVNDAEIFAVQVLRASLVKITGVQTPDLVGFAQDDNTN
jgi:hypothetical protein